MKQWYVFEMNGFTEEEAQRLFDKVFSKVEWAEEHSMGISHLTERGVADLKKHVFRQGESE
ncbi:hypothetical protein G7058_00125 [Jeotgalibaca porci]|uniref:Uncharacterized protein n=1 Tax=Jeotgalibaca porci TaxID=1868793 RepID=A0A6G7WE60_9LACT|nr:hypothetical protein [Jeotgalibaca porci]QIK50605.1 hypothetical protein G7058_00125 [Jeotgalibaca porci]